MNLIREAIGALALTGLLSSCGDGSKMTSQNELTDTIPINGETSNFIQRVNAASAESALPQLDTPSEQALTDNQIYDEQVDKKMDDLLSPGFKRCLQTKTKTVCTEERNDQEADVHQCVREDETDGINILTRMEICAPVPKVITGQCVPEDGADDNIMTPKDVCAPG